VVAPEKSKQMINLICRDSAGDQPLAQAGKVELKQPQHQRERTYPQKGSIRLCSCPPSTAIQLLREAQPDPRFGGVIVRPSTTTPKAIGERLAAGAWLNAECKSAAGTRSSSLICFFVKV